MTSKNTRPSALAHIISDRKGGQVQVTYDGRGSWVLALDGKGVGVVADTPEGCLEECAAKMLQELRELDVQTRSAIALISHVMEPAKS